MSLPPALALARRALPRAAARSCGRLAYVACCAALAACLLPAAQVRAQAANGQIYIPGPGEAHTASAGMAPSGARDDTTNGMITIPGPGEARTTPNSPTPETGASPASANGMITIPGPSVVGTRTAATHPQAAASAALAREAAAPAASREVLPIYVTPAPRAPRAVLPVAAEPPAGAVPGASGSAAAPAARLMADAAKAAAPVPAGQQDGESIRLTALTFLQQQSAGLPGKISITVAPAFPRGLAACTTLVPFMPSGARLWGRTTVAVRCAGERPWTLYLQARISMEATYYVAAHQIEPGSLLSVADLVARDGDLANLPREVITDPSQAVGAVALSRIGAGTLLRQDLLRSATSVAIGQTVHVVALGQGFSISSEGSVMNNAAPGQQVRVRLEGGQIVSGVVKDSATVELQM